MSFCRRRSPAGSAGRPIELSDEQYLKRSQGDNVRSLCRKFRIDGDENVRLKLRHGKILSVLERVPATLYRDVPGHSPRDTVAEESHFQFGHANVLLQGLALGEMAATDTL